MLSQVAWGRLRCLGPAEGPVEIQLSVVESQTLSLSDHH
jgi:hypothetical protein